MSIENLIALLEEMVTFLSELFFTKFYLFLKHKFSFKLLFYFFSKSNMKLLLLFKSFFKSICQTKPFCIIYLKLNLDFLVCKKENCEYFFLFYKKGHE